MLTWQACLLGLLRFKPYFWQSYFLVQKSDLILKYKVADKTDYQSPVSLCYICSAQSGTVELMKLGGGCE